MTSAQLSIAIRRADKEVGEALKRLHLTEARALVCDVPEDARRNIVKTWMNKARLSRNVALASGEFMACFDRCQMLKARRLVDEDDADDDADDAIHLEESR